MRFNCPNCDITIEIIDDGVDSDEVSCPTCGSNFPAGAFGETKVFSPSSRFGKFELLEHVGAGQFGTVWRARDTKLDRMVAIKIPRMVYEDGMDRKSFLREAKAIAAIDHPNVIRVLEIEEIDNQVAIVSEFVAGETLRDFIKRGRIPFRESAQLTLDILKGVQAAHLLKIVHRDLKPANVLLDEKRRPVITDFGLAKFRSAHFTMTAKGVILGTPAYMSPEQARGDSHLADQRSDLYSIGIILYEMLTGRPPFSGSSDLLFQQILSMDPRRPRDVDRHVPRDLETICLKAMRKEPEKRYQAATEFIQDLELFLAAKPIHAQPVTWFEHTWKYVKKNLTASVTVVLACIFLIVANSIMNTASDSDGIDAPSVANAEEEWTPIAWDPDVPEDFWAPRDTSGPMRVRSTTSNACFLSNNSPAKNYQAEVKVKLQNDQSQGGIAFGVHQTGENPDTYSGYFACVGPKLSDGSGMWLRVESCDFATNSSGYAVRKGGMCHVIHQLDSTFNSDFSLSVQSDEGRIVQVEYNGEVIDYIPLQDLESFSMTRCGVVAFGHVIFPDFAFRPR